MLLIEGGSMDTYFGVDYSKCKKCYECVLHCTELYKERGFLGFLTISSISGIPRYDGDNCRCHCCEGGAYSCNDLCPNGAMEIERW